MELHTAQQQKFWLILAFFFLMCLIIYPYVKTEYITRTVSEDFIIECLKRESENSLTQSYKIIDYQKSRGRAKMYCFYSKSGNDLEILLERQENIWKVVYSRKLSENGAFYWPYYP